MPASMPLRIVSLLLLAAAAAAAKAPNVVIVMADDMGYGDVRALNPQSRIPTPHLDRLAAQGVTFLDAHTPSAVCTPTRYGLVTGRYSWRTRLKSGVLNGYGEPLIEPGRETIGSFLRAQGYATAVVGKWHLGLGFAKTAAGAFDFSKPISDGPHTRGFDYSYVIPASLDFPPYVYIRNGRITAFPLVEQLAIQFPRFMRKGERAPDLDPAKVLDDLVREAAGFIGRQAKQAKPFLLYMPLTAPHKPTWPHKRFRGKTRLGPYGDFIAQVDAAVGEVLRSLDEAGAADNTLVIYTSDNGSYMYRLDGAEETDHADDETIQAYRSLNHTANYVFRGTKADIWEAGHRVPFFARWPGEIESGGKQAEPICLTDIFATLADVAGAALPEDAAEDSFSLLPLLRGGPRARPRAPIIHHSGGGMFAVRDGRWKLVAGNGSGGREAPKGKPFARPYRLFDLEADLSERRNVIERYPETANRLEQALERIRARGRSR